jgi:mannose-6-phosphate isomerase
VKLYPLKFTPRLVEKMWGGRKLERVLGKSLPPDQLVGESWEIFDFPPGVVDGSRDWVSSVVANGPLAGRSLHRILEQFERDVLGDVPTMKPHGQFPLLIKFLDAREDLSVQVHPDERYAAVNPHAHLKCEAWYVIERDPGALIFKGLRSGTTRQAFRSAIERGSVERHLGTIAVNPGDCHYLHSGTVHALGAGILVAEVQTPSDTTFRVYDFNRVDPATDRPRTLHVEQAMQCITFADDAVGGAIGQSVREQSGSEDALVCCPYFQIHKHVAGPGKRRALLVGEPSIVMMLQGEARLTHDAAANAIATPLRQGETALIPASLSDPHIAAEEDASWLQISFPTRHER